MPPADRLRRLYALQGRSDALCAKNRRSHNLHAKKSKNHDDEDYLLPHIDPSRHKSIRTKRQVHVVAIKA